MNNSLGGLQLGRGCSCTCSSPGPHSVAHYLQGHRGSSSGRGRRSSPWNRSRSRSSGSFSRTSGSSGSYTSSSYTSSSYSSRSRSRGGGSRGRQQSPSLDRRGHRSRRLEASCYRQHSVDGRRWVVHCRDHVLTGACVGVLGHVLPSVCTSACVGVLGCVVACVCTDACVGVQSSTSSECCERSPAAPQQALLPSTARVKPYGVTVMFQHSSTGATPPLPSPLDSPSHL